MHPLRRGPDVAGTQSAARQRGARCARCCCAVKGRPPDTTSGRAASGSQGMAWASPSGDGMTAEAVRW